VKGEEEDRFMKKNGRQKKETCFGDGRYICLKNGRYDKKSA